MHCIRVANGSMLSFDVSDSQMEQGYRSEVQERALVVSLQMFNLILERGVSLLKSQLDSSEEPRMVVSEDMQVLLPAIKVFPLSMAYLMELLSGFLFSKKLSPYREKPPYSDCMNVIDPTISNNYSKSTCSLLRDPKFNLNFIDYVSYEIDEIYRNF